MDNFAQAIRNYQLVRRKLPGTLNELTRTDTPSGYPYIDGIPDDPWGNPYDYRVLGAERFEIYSNGEDGMPDTEDDFVVVGGGEQ